MAQRASRVGVMSQGAALVTGAGGSLGRAIAERLASDGYQVAVVDIDIDSAKQTVANIEAAGGNALAIECDLRDEHQIAAAFVTATEAFGPVLTLVNNAAIFPLNAFVDTPIAELDETTAINQRAYFIAAQHAARAMIEAGGGVIVNVASIVWHGRWTNMVPYVAAKGAIIATTRALARELGEHNIRVNAVAPGAFTSAGESQQHPDMDAYEKQILGEQALKRRGQAHELAAAVSFMCGDESSFITGQTLNVDGGWVMS